MFVSPSTAPNQPNSSARWFRWVVLGLVLLGVGLRVAAGYSRPGLWYDEILWLDRFLDGFKRGIRAPGYAFLHHHYFIWLDGLQEYKIRIVSILSGLAVVPLFACLAHVIFKNPKLTAFGTLLVAVNIAAVSFTHEFKPYSLELFLHTAWLLSLLGFTNKRIAVWISSAILIGGLMLSYGLIPLIAFQVAYTAYLLWKRRIRALDLLLCLALCSGYLYYFFGIYPRLKGAKTSQWGKKYGVFFDPRVHGEGVLAYLTWFFLKVSTYLSYPLNWFRELPYIDRAAGFKRGYGYVEVMWLGIAYCFALLWRVTRTRFDDERLIPIYLLAGYTLAGILRIYPLGFFRANLFILLYATLALLFILEGVLEYLSPRQGNLALCAVLAPTIFCTLTNPLGAKFFYNLDWSKTVAKICRESESNPVTVLTDAKTGFAFNFYRKTSASPECSQRLKRNVFTSPETLERLLQRHQRAYVFFAGGPKLLPDGIHSLITERYGGTLVTGAGGMYEYQVPQQ